MRLASCSHRRACSLTTWHSSIKSETDAFTKAGKVIIKLGIYGKVPEPEMETFAKDRQDWGISQKRTKGFKIAAGGEEE